jgi:hypothetical protein
MRAVRVLSLALSSLVASATLAAGTADAQLWKPVKKPTAAAPARPARTKPAKAKRARRTKPRPAARPAVVRDDPPRRERSPSTRDDDLPELDDSPVIVVELPARGER